MSIVQSPPPRMGGEDFSKMTLMEERSKIFARNGGGGGTESGMRGVGWWFYNRGMRNFQSLIF